METSRLPGGALATAAAGAHAFVEVAGLSHAYRSGGVEARVLDRVDLRLRAGGFTAVLGPSGCGKTTLLNLLGGLEPPAPGAVRVGGVDLGTLSPRGLSAYRRDTVSFIFQFYNLLPSLTALENVACGLEARGTALREAQERSRSMLEAVGLAHRMDRFPSQLSGGEQQRVAIARALAREAPLLLADEPTGNLDSRSGEAVMALFRRAHAERRATILLITHDSEIASSAESVLRMADGRLEG